MDAAQVRTSALAAVLPYAAVIGAMCAFQVGASFAKALFPAVGPQGAATLRVVLAAAMLLVVVRPWRAWSGRTAMPSMAGLGLATAGMILFFYLALDRLPQGVAITLQFLGPLGVAIASSRRASDLVWAALAAAGVWGLVGHDLTRDGLGQLDILGVGFALAAAACWAVYIVWGQAASRAYGSATPALAISIAALVLIPVGVHQAGLPALLRPELVPLALLVALISTAIPFSLELYALPRMPARTFAVLISLEPAFGALSGLVLLHERLAPAQLVGVCAVVVAASGAAWSNKPRLAPATPAEIPPT